MNILFYITESEDKILLYRLITENKNRAIIENRVKQYFGDFTIIEATGYWCKQKERGLIIEIDSGKRQQRLIIKLAKEIKAINVQDAVMVQRLSSKTVFI